MPDDEAGRMAPELYRVEWNSKQTHAYFPELHLSRWFREHEGQDVPIYCFERTGVRPLVNAYGVLSRELSLDAIVLIDGGSDSLMRGDEDGLGTPEEDAASVTAVNEIDLSVKLLACIGFGVDYHHGISHWDFLEAVAELTRQGGYLGLTSLLAEMPEVAKYRAASNFVFKAMPRMESIVSASILSAVDGHFGDYHATARTTGELWINPLMPVYWWFELAEVAKRLLYREAILGTEDLPRLQAAIAVFRNRLPKTRPARRIPI
jgi:hypothetical protein